MTLRRRSSWSSRKFRQRLLVSSSRDIPTAWQGICTTAEFWSDAEEVLVEAAALCEIEQAEIQQAANQNLEAEVYVSEEKMRTAIVTKMTTLSTKKGSFIASCSICPLDFLAFCGYSGCVNQL